MAYYLLMHLKGDRVAPVASDYRVIDITLDRRVTDIGDERITD